eukprot:3837140-Rhodomonas_salina.2
MQDPLHMYARQDARRQAKTIAVLLKQTEPSGLTNLVISQSSLVCKDTAHVYEVCGVPSARQCALSTFTNDDLLDEYFGSERWSQGNARGSSSAVQEKGNIAMETRAQGRETASAIREKGKHAGFEAGSAILKKGKDSVASILEGRQRSSAIQEKG